MNIRQVKDQAHDQIVLALQAWGLTPHKERNCVLCGLGALRARCVDVQILHGGQMASLMVDLQVQPGLTLRENVMQIAESTDKAIGGAIYQWTLSVFVTVAALLDAEGCPGHLAGCEKRIFAMQNGKQRSWNLFSSPFILLGESDSTKANRMAEAVSDYQADTLPLIEPFLPALCLKPQLYAIKTFLINSEVDIHGDCTVNGVSSPRLFEAVKRFEWPPGQGMRMLRQFHIAAPADFSVDTSLPALGVSTPKQGLLGRFFSRH
jgi:hypothetical protein